MAVSVRFAPGKFHPDTLCQGLPARSGQGQGNIVVDSPRYPDSIVSEQVADHVDDDSNDEFHRLSFRC